MVVRGVYSEVEKEIIEEYDREADAHQGWYTPPPGRGLTVTAEAIKQHVATVDPWNPFYSEDEHALASRWGGLVAHPFFMDRFKPGTVPINMKKGLFCTLYLVGHDFEFYQPIRPGDTIRTWAYRPTMEDSTDESGQGKRKLRMVRSNCDFINQRDEIIGAEKTYSEFTFHESRPPAEKYIEDYGYTQQELDYLAEVYEAEKPRGSLILYWEDVNVGDELPPVTTGPTRRISLASLMPPSAPGPRPRRIFPRYVEPLGPMVMTQNVPYVPDPVTGLLYPTQGGRHDDDRSAQFEGAPHAWTYNTVPRYSMARLVTNWMGNDGYICKWSWRHVMRTPIGDTFLVNGKVINKYVDNGEHLVDIRAWCLNLRGTIADYAIATVKLVSREETFPVAEKVIKR